MIRIESITQLPTANTYAVIINCDTNWHATLALAACHAHARMPILLIDCQSTEESRSHFRRLASQTVMQFFWLEWPLRPHGLALDALLAGMPASRVLLVDSDLEIVGERLVEDMAAMLDASQDTYGAGFVHAAGWMEPPVHALPRGTGYHMERMWIPLVLLDVERVREVLQAGESFMAYRDHAEFGGGRLACIVFHRFKLPLLRKLSLPRIPRPGLPVAAWFEYDTGARVHRALGQRGYGFAALPEARWSEARHYHGATRAQLGGHLKRLAQRWGLVAREGDGQIANGSSAVQARLTQWYPEAARALGLGEAIGPGNERNQSVGGDELP